MKSKTFLNINLKQWLVIFLLACLAFFSYLMLRIMFYYIPIKEDVAFLQLKTDYLHIASWKFAFFVHVFTSIVTLLAGFTQFSKLFLRKYPFLHRKLGYVYVVNILLVTGPSSFLMSFYANGGLISRIAFIVLSVLWMAFTAIAVFYAIKRKFKLHQAFMIRSYALTLSAITLRIWKMGLANFTDILPMDRYRIVAWVGFGLNLIVAEFIIAAIKKKNSPRSAYNFNNHEIINGAKIRR